MIIQVRRWVWIKEMTEGVYEENIGGLQYSEFNLGGWKGVEQGKEINFRGIGRIIGKRLYQDLSGAPCSTKVKGIFIHITSIQEDNKRKYHTIYLTPSNDNLTLKELVKGLRGQAKKLKRVNAKKEIAKIYVSSSYLGV